MPTALPIRSEHAAAIQRLSWPNKARVAILLLRIRWLNRRLEVASARVERQALDIAGPALLLTARRWVAAHEAMNVLLKTPELPEVRQVRAMMRGPRLT